MKKLKQENDYIGLWYACDRSEETFITTEFYYGSGEPPVKPLKFQEELKENSFKQLKKFTIPTEYDSVWIAMHTEGLKYCRLKVYEIQQEKTYIKKYLVRTKSKKGSRLRFLLTGM